MVRYKIQFVVTSELLFKHVAQFIPVEDLHIEELVEIPKPTFKLPEAPMQTVKARKPYVKHRPPDRPLDSTTGMNAVILRALADGQPHPVSRLRKALIDAGYSKSSYNSQITKMQTHNLVQRETPGWWRLKYAPQSAQDTPRTETDSGAEHHEHKEGAGLD